MNDSIFSPDSAFSYRLPEDRIADRPVHPYHEALLLVADRQSGKLRQSKFLSLPEFLAPSDLLIFNNTKVIPARLFGRLETSGEVEILLLAAQGENIWRVLGRPLKKFKAGVQIIFSKQLKAEVLERVNTHEAILKFSVTDSTTCVAEALACQGLMPIPPYIRGGRGDSEDLKDYQSPYAKEAGSVAAPTASLHFTPELHAALSAHGCSHDFVTLHLSTASFLPVIDKEGEYFTEPGIELCRYNPTLLSRVQETRRLGGRVVAVGTSVVRALETIAIMQSEENFCEGAYYETSLFIRPGFKFQCVDAMVTNFHQPGTSHMLMLQAFMGEELLRKSYALALAEGFRFLSYGDGMLIL